MVSWKKLVGFFGMVMMLFVLFVGSANASVKKWTIMVYLDADNNLESAGVKDLNEMETVGSDGNINIVVQMDRTSGYDTSNGNWTGARRYYVTKDYNSSTIGSQLVQDLGEVNMGDPNTLKNFVEWAMTNYPAERYMLVFWNHGGGWRDRVEGSASMVKGVSWDSDNGNDYLEMREVTSALESAINNVHHKIDVIGFDACLMGLFEVAYAVQGPSAYKTDAVIASQKTEPGDGWDYTEWLKTFRDNPTGDTLTLSKSVVTSYYNFYSGSQDTTQALYDMSKLNDVVNAVNALSNYTGDWDVAYDAFNNAKSSDGFPYRDFGQIASYMKDHCTNSTNVQLATDLLNAIDAFVYYNKNTGSSYAYNTGVNIYAPKTDNDYNSGYQNNEWPYYTATYCAFAGDTYWRSFLEKVHNPPADNGGNDGGNTSGDSYEPNDSMSNAYAVQAGQTYHAYISSSSDVDYFKFVASSNGTLDITAGNFGGNDYDVYLYNAGGTQLAKAYTTNDPEKITGQSIDAGTYYIKVVGYNGAYSTSAQYYLTLNFTADNSGDNGGNSGTPEWHVSALSSSVQTPHNYSNNWTNTWTFKRTGAQRVAVHFSIFEFENNYDFVYIYDGNGNKVHTYTGSQSAFWTIVDDDTLVVKAVTDYSVTKYGYVIDRVAYYSDHIIDRLQGKVMNITGKESITFIPGSPVKEASLRNYPNPFNPETDIIFVVKKSGNVVVNIYNTKGKLVKTLAKGYFGAGTHRKHWAGRDNNGRQVASGIYYCVVKGNGFRAVRKMILLK